MSGDNLKIIEGWSMGRAGEACPINVVIGQSRRDTSFCDGYFVVIALSASAASIDHRSYNSE
jgi:hypothetical protein